MTSATVPERFRDRLRSPVLQLNVVGIVLVGAALVPTHGGEIAVGVVVLGVLALVSWAGWTLLRPGRSRDLALVLGAASAAVGAGLGAPTLLAPLISALLVAFSDVAHPAKALGVLVAGTAVALTLAAVAHGMDLGDLVSLLAGLAVGALAGVTRRQRRLADLRQQELLERSLVAEREAQRAQLLEARSAVARDVHDVLAHSLGGLVLQLDAIEALLEHGRVEEATARASDARRLAGEGLQEARRAVATLRDPDASAPAQVPDDALDRLLDEHRAFAGPLETIGEPTLDGIDTPHREALVAALREALVNVRRHAPRTPASVRFDRTAHAMVLRVENPLPATSTPSVTGGHGLLGMRERFAALGDGSTATAGARGSTFVVEATAVLP